MTEPFVSRGFRGRRQPGATGRRLTPGQYETRGFPVLSAGPTPRTSLATWDFTGRGPSAPVARWTWDEFEALPHETVTTDIHCVTKWSELDTVWGVSVDMLLAEAFTRGVESAPYVLAVSDGGYTVPHPLRALPEVEVRHRKARRAAVLARLWLDATGARLVVMATLTAPSVA